MEEAPDYSIETHLEVWMPPFQEPMLDWSKYHFVATGKNGIELRKGPFVPPSPPKLVRDDFHGLTVTWTPPNNEDSV